MEPVSSGAFFGAWPGGTAEFAHKPKREEWCRMSCVCVCVMCVCVCHVCVCVMCVCVMCLCVCHVCVCLCLCLCLRVPPFSP